MPKSRPRFASNPLEVLLPLSLPPDTGSPMSPDAGAVPRAPVRERYSVMLQTDIIARIRSACYHLPNLTVGELVEDAVMVKIAALECERGEAFPVTPNIRLRAGRPVGRGVSPADRGGGDRRS